MSGLMRPVTCRRAKIDGMADNGEIPPRRSGMGCSVKPSASIALPPVLTRVAT